VPVRKGETIDVERTRQKIRKAATELFYREGTAVGVEDLARHAAVSKPSLYRHFGSKKGLLEDVLRHRSDRVVAWLSAASGQPTDPVERALAVFDALRGWYAERPFRGCAIVKAASEERELDGPAHRQAGVHLGRHLELLTALAADTGVADPQLVGRQLLILLEGATVVAAVTRDPSAADDARRVARTLLAGTKERARPLRQRA
jgi:AcrR family transcriptional regulator